MFYFYHSLWRLIMQLLEKHYLCYLVIIFAASNLKHCICFCEECWYLIIIIATSLLIGNFTLGNRCKIFSILNINWINLIIEHGVCEWWIEFIKSCLLKDRKIFQPYWFYVLACLRFFFCSFLHVLVSHVGLLRIWSILDD